MKLVGAFGLLLVLAFVVVQLAGCAANRPPPTAVECRGKGTITGQGEAAIALVGSGSNNFVLTVDCGDGVFFKQTPAPPDVPPAP